MAASFSLWVQDERLAYDRDLLMAVLTKEKQNMDFPLEIQQYLQGKRPGELFFEVRPNLLKGGYDIRISLEVDAGPVQTVDYEGVSYQLYDELSGFIREIERSKTGILRSSYEAMPGQIQEIFQTVSQWAGRESRELKGVTDARLYCGSCGVAYTANLVSYMGLPYTRSKVPSACPRCGSQVVLYLYKI